MGGLEPAAGLQKDVEHCVDRARGLGPAPGVLADDELERDEDAVVERLDAVDLRDVRVAEACHGTRLLNEAGALLLAAGVAQELHRDAAIEVRVIRGVDDTHAARTDLLEHQIAPDRAAARERQGCLGLGRVAARELADDDATVGAAVEVRLHLFGGRRRKPALVEREQHVFVGAGTQGTAAFVAEKPQRCIARAMSSASCASTSKWPLRPWACSASRASTCSSSTARSTPQEIIKGAGAH